MTPLSGPDDGGRRHQLRSLIWRASVADEVDAELAFHVEMVVRELIEKGASPEAARAEALRRFGDLEAVRGACATIGTRREEEMRRTEYLSEIKQDVAFAIRQLRKTKAFTTVAVLTLALGIGATAAIFSAVQSVVLRPFAHADPERVTFLFERWKDLDGSVSDGNYWDWTQQVTSFEALGALRYSSFNLADEESPERVLGARATHGLFRVFDVRPFLGRVFTAEEDEPGRNMVTVLSHQLWTRRFDADPSIIGRPIRLGGGEYTVIGVMPATFDPTLSDEELWVPMALTAERKAEHDEHHLVVIGLLKPNVTRERAQTEMEQVMQGLAERYPDDNADRSARVAPFAEILIGDYRERLFILLGAVGFVLLIACGNVANLLLARGAARGKEIAIRAAVGAGRGRIVRQMLTESVVLSVVAAVIGLGLAYGGIRLLVASAPPGIPRLDQTRIDGVVLAFTVGIALLSSMVFGMMPALRAARQNLQGVLKEGGRSVGGSTRDRVRTSLVTLEVALAVMLLVGAGLLIRSASFLGRVDPGFSPRGVLAARVALPKESYADPGAVARAFKEIVADLGRQPGVRSAAIVSQAPLGPGGGSNGLVPEGRALSAANSIDSRMRIVTPDYFSTMGISLQAGRTFTDRDVAGMERVMIVTEALARQAWPNESAIGKRIACCEGSETDPRWKTIVGVVKDVRSQGPAVAAVPEFFVPIDQVPPEAWEWTQRTMTLVAKANGDPATITGAMRAAVKRVDPAVPLYSITTMDDAIRSATAESRFNTLLLTTLGTIGLLLAAVGVYSVIGYFVSLRSHEIGVRMALGASARDILGLMTWQGVRPVLVGVVLGMLAAAGVTRLLRSSLYGVTATDPATFGGVVAILVAVGLLASLIPARRATLVDPTRALQEA